ncbi:MAG: hypothetical protein GX786_04120 [Clostridiales bacterium]|nr:hypothetical protein [Clostridiales bacterium]
MLCEECKLNEANVLITMLVQNEKRTRHLCQSCVDKLKENFQQGDIESFLSIMMALIPENETESKTKLVCSTCGLEYDVFQKTGKLGCAQCYQDFQHQLAPLLRRIHGRSQHAGRVPMRYQRPTEVEEKIEDSQSQQGENEMDTETMLLRKEMEEAVAQENFELAAVLRDKIKERTIQMKGENYVQQDDSRQ